MPNVLSPISPRVFACYSKKKSVLKRSSSGGVFFSIASEIITGYKGVVYGCVVDWDNVYHTRAETIDGLIPMLGSKYVRSHLKNTFIECSEDLKKGRWVLYSGTPCQINALTSFLKFKSIKTDKLITIDVICHGTPKISYWREYLNVNFLKKEKTINFRYKKNNWENFYLKIGNYEGHMNVDPYLRAFLKNDILHESCFNCKAKGENRHSDITIGDFWGVDKVDKRIKNDKGTSLLIVRNREDFILNILKKTCKIKEVPYLLAIYNLNHAYYLSVTKGENYGKQIGLKISTNALVDKSNEINTSLKHRLSKTISKLGLVKKTIYCNNKNRVNNNKVGIITEIGYFNFGNRLQNYALLSYLKSIGKNPTNILCYDKSYNGFHYLYKRIRGFEDKKRYKLTEAIYNTSIKYEGKPFVFSPGKKLQRKLCNFESIIIGSDQIWNCSYHKYNNDLRYSLGNFGILNRNFKLISYSASMCVDKLNDEQEFLFKHSLSNFDGISVREKQSEKLLDSIGVKSKTVVDPTLLLTVNQWNTAIEKYANSPVIKEKYCLIYFLGEGSVLPDFISEKEIKIVSFADPQFTKGMNQFDFINYVKNAEIVVTDSFHAIVFSAIFKKKIVILNRNLDAMISRIENLFEIIRLPLSFNEVIDLSLADRNNLQKEILNSKQFLNEVIK